MEIVLKDKLVRFMKKRGVDSLTVKLPRAKGC